MGFFKDYKDELVTPTDEPVTDAPVEETADLDSLIREMEQENIQTSSLENVNGGDDTVDDFDESVLDDDFLYSLLEDTESEEIVEDKNLNTLDAVIEAIEPEETAVVENTAPKMEVPKEELTEEEKRAVTVITKGTTINGSIVSDCSLDVMGTINGDVECLGKLTISGKVTGNTLASEVFVNTNRLVGNVNSEGAVKIALGTVIIGDINAASGVIAGAVKGEIDITGPIVIDSTAIIKGNVKAKSVQMNNGAVLEGFCSLSYASVDIDNIFE